jgi:hypothetical protein
VRTHKLPWGGEFTTEYDETSTMNVPLLEGGDVNVSGSKGEGAKVVATRSADETTLDTSVLKGNADKKEDSKKKIAEEVDRYHELKEAIEDVENELDRLGAAKDRAFGKDKLKYMDAENKALEEQIVLQEDLVAAMKTDFVKDQAELNKWGFSTDASGRISNYEEVYKKRISEYNAMVDAGQKDEADKKWEEFEKALEQYEETLNGLEKEETNLINKRYDAEEKRLEDI